MEFATKARQAQQMVQRAVDAGVPLAWFTADEIYGQAKYLRSWLKERGVSYVLAIRRCDTFTTAAGEQRAGALLAALPARSGSGRPPAPGRTAPANTTRPGSKCRPDRSRAAGAGC